MTIHPGESEWPWKWVQRQVPEHPATPQDWEDTKGT